MDENNKTRNILKHIHRISTNNKYIYEHFKGENVFYIPNGVDPLLFSTLENKSYDPGRIRLGWVGNRDRATKNFSIVRKLSKLPDFQFSTVATLKSKSYKKTRQHMIDFYRSIDFLIVSSSTEGTPNPALEAASCGVPIITTPVGNMPDLIKDEENGFIVDSPKYTLFKEVLQRKVKDISEDGYWRMSQNIRSSIMDGWKWKDRKRLYGDFLLKG